jgi:hypothetical protein
VPPEKSTKIQKTVSTHKKSPRRSESKTIELLFQKEIDSSTPEAEKNRTRMFFVPLKS